MIELPNTYATELSLERRTIILKLHGQVDPTPQREWESFVVTEDDYIDYLAQSDVSASVPVGLAAKLRRSHFLFLGYTMADWNLRVVLNRLWGDHPLSYRSWAVQPEAKPLEREFWRRLDVDVLELPLEEYVEALGRYRRRGCRRELVSVVAGAPASPYKGLAPFGDSELDALLFFGRERERDRRREPAGLAADRALRRERRRQELAPPRRRRAVAPAGPRRGGGRLLLVGGRSESRLRRGDRRGRRNRVTTHARRAAPAASEAVDGDVYLILDQFEEFFLYHEGDPFAGRARGCSGSRVSA